MDRNVLDLWVGMAGPAGVGKSSLTEWIANSLREQDVPVDAFGEEEFFTRLEFAQVADGFRTKHYAGPEVFEGAYEAWLSTLAAGAIAIMDWNPAGMAGDLPSATGDRGRFRRHLQVIRALARGRVLLLHLEAPAEVAVDRAGRERGEEWFARSDHIARSAGHQHAERIDRLIAEATSHAGRTRDELQVAAEAGWPVRTIDANRPASDVQDRALSLINRTLTRPVT